MLIRIFIHKKYTNNQGFGAGLFSGGLGSENFFPGAGSGSWELSELWEHYFFNIFWSVNNMSKILATLVYLVTTRYLLVYFLHLEDIKRGYTYTIQFALIIKLKFKLEPEPETGQSDGSGSSQIPPVPFI